MMWFWLEEFKEKILFKKLSSAIFSRFYGYFTDTKYDNEIANFGIYNRKVIESILKISDYIKFFPLFVNFVGYNITSIEVEHASEIQEQQVIALQSS